MKTIVLDDDTFTVLRSALDHSVPTMEEPKPPIPAPSKDSVIVVPWQVRTGTFSTTIDPGETVDFDFTPQNTNGKLASFAVSPSNDSAYAETEMSLAGLSVSGQGGRLYFSVGGYPKDRYGRETTRYPDLTPGQMQTITVRLKDPTATAKINYALMPA